MIAVQSQPIDVGAVLASVEDDTAGAVVLFLGRVRERSRERDVVHLDYEAYGEMACSELEALAAQARETWTPMRLSVVHRTGRLAIGEVAVAVAVASCHREEAFAAARWLIDTLKVRVPIWKKETYGDGCEWVSETP